jgi:hypothetical protein
MRIERLIHDGVLIVSKSELLMKMRMQPCNRDRATVGALTGLYNHYK